MRSTIALHVGCGTFPIPRWINIDIVPYEGVDRVIDVVQELPYSDVDYIFAEHFIEHLALVDAMRFLHHCREALSESGVLRLSTPNLDWVWLTHYAPPAKRSANESLVGCLEINRAFHGWGHRFVYNYELLSLVLQNAGFSNSERCEYGRSRHQSLSGLERHERAVDHPDADHIVIVEASGYRDVIGKDAEFEELMAPYLRDFDVQ